MTVELASAPATYFAAKNRRDVDAMLEPFAKDATVKDEGKEHRGRDAIRTWMEHTTHKYGVTVDIREAEQSGDDVVVKGLVSGDFPGSPIMLVYRFRLRGSKIAGLQIGQ